MRGIKYSLNESRIMFEIGLTLLFLGITVVVVLASLFFWGLKHAIALAINSVIGFLALYAVQAFLLPSLVINAWSVALVAVLGLIGLLLVLFLHGIGWAF